MRLSTLAVKGGPRDSVNLGVRTILCRRLLGALYAGLAAYCCLSLVFGPAGLMAQAALEGDIGAMRENLTRLEELNGSLVVELDSLAGDPDRARIEARSLGWLEDGERELVIAGSTPAPRREAVIGEPVDTGERATLADGDVKTLSLGIAVLFLLVVLVRDPDGGQRPQRLRRVQTASRV